jgi:hypothetical protein
MMNRNSVIIFLAFCAISLTAGACSKGAPQAANTNAEQTKQAEIEAKAPHLSATVRGDIERMGLAVQTALDALKDSRWSEVSSQLGVIDKELTGALSDTPEKKKAAALRDALQEMKPVVERTIRTADSRGKETESQLRELQTRVNALKAIYGS